MEDQKDSVREEGHAADTTTYRVYKRRWAMMLTNLLLNLSNIGLCFNLAPVAYKAADYFQVTPLDITWFTQVFFIVPVTLSFVSTFIFNKFGIKAGMHVGSALNCTGAVIRAVATSGLISDSKTQYIISLLGQVLAATGQLFIVFSVTKISQNWFPDEGRMMATTLMSSFPPLGISMAQVMSPLIVTEKQQIPTLNYVYGGLAVLGEVTTLVCVTRSRPPTPPSRSAAQGKKVRAPYLQQLKNTFTCLPFLGLLLLNGINTGVFLCLNTLSQQILCSSGYSDLFSGVVVAIFMISGFLSSIPIAVVANRTKAITSIVKIVNGLGVVFAIFMLEVYLVPGQHAFLITASILYGITACGVFAIGLELGVETTYPVEETISTTLLYVVGQILGVIIIYTVTILSSDPPRQLEQIEVCTKGITSDLQARDYSGVITGLMVILSVNIILFILFFHTPYKRREAEKTTEANNPTFRDSFNASSTRTSSLSEEL